MSLFGTRHHQHVCGFYYLDSSIVSPFQKPQRRYLPPLSQSLHARIIASTSRTTLTQSFANPSSTASIPELRYNFPLYDGVSVVAFTCTINKDRVIRGLVQEKNTARKTYDDAVANGQTAALFEQLPDASDVFTTTVGNVPAGAHISVEIEYLGELKHDAEVDGIRFTIPTSIAPRFGSYPGTLLDKPTNVSTQGGISIVVDAEVPAGSVIKSIQSPSHPIAVSVGSTSTMSADAAPSLQFASATLSLGTAQLDDDFIIQVIATNTSNPVAVLETHPTIPHQQALMATFVPKFKLAPTKPEIVFICDRSGSMQGSKIDDLKNALKVFLKSLPVGAMFNICSFGSSYSFLFDKSVTYDKNTLETAMKHVDTFDANYGGTRIHGPIQKTFELRHPDLDLEVFVLTDGEVWNEERLFTMVDDRVQKSQGAIRLFTLGVGRDVSHSLIEGLARAGNGFSQAVSENEKMSGKVVRMLKGALTPHVNDYTLELKYADAESETEPEDDFDIIEPATAASPKPLGQDAPDFPQKPISLFDSSADDDVDTEAEQPHVDGAGAERYSHVPAVKPPKVLRAPFQIPPLYPFSRTTTYLILSPDRELKDKTPESLILRGTSPQGPLELQIPITILQDKAETIHQLAARKAVKELEEGRGWIFHANAKDGQSLKDKHPGRFPTMVEREAVRLGIQFQVGGKWCSFVAVDSDPPRARSTEDELCVAAEMPPDNGVAKKKMKKVGMGPATSFDQSVVLCGSEPLLYESGNLSMKPPSRAGSMFPSVNRLFGREPPKTQSSHHRPISEAFGRPASGSASSNPFGPPSTSSQPPVGRDFFGGPTSTSSTAAAFGRRSGGSFAGGLFGGQSSGFGGGLFGTGAPSAPPPPPLAAPALAPPAAQVDEALLVQYRKEVDDVACMPLDDPDDDDDVAPAVQQMSQNVSPMSVAVGDVWTKPVYHSQTPADQFYALVSMQEFSGYWVWSDKLFAVLGVSPQDVKSTVEQTVQGSQGPIASSTAAVVAFLRKRLVDERDSWEMMEEKAVAWLEAELGDESEKLLAALGQLF
ncbi:vault protein inter-alpha-trypsin [Colletotrichum navitas]|uniref:Vault protein inter-alpha-trypsin n=1 Tax=Colletotrichum navitas TaxID=681940 RepID=A0AAD8PRL3_9PEZI|nr:vault protein inter-alpha-trypsin [Colletotrichum navitas]KAK1574623.1 vault protein inter-alpha-trypsin [Colletotrichum navitas]